MMGLKAFTCKQFDLLLLLLLLLLFTRYEVKVPFINLNLTIKFYYRFVISNQMVLLF